MLSCLVPGTLESRSNSLEASDARVSRHLVRLLDAGAPLAAPSRHALDGVTLVELGRSERASAARDGGRLVLGVPDARMSERHARLVVRAGRWLVEDAGS